jgi:hypothetical protein
MNEQSYIKLTNGGFNIPAYPPCRGLWGKVFGHKLEPRYSRTTVGAPSAAPQIENTLARLMNPPAVAFANDGLGAEVRRSIEALANYETHHTHDVCVRCGLTVPAPERSVILKPVPATTQPTQHAAPPVSSPAKLVVVPVSASAAVGAGQASSFPNPVKAVPGRGPKIP